MSPSAFLSAMLASRVAHAAALAFAICVAGTPAVIAIARRKGLLAKPREDRWHKTPTALFGGVAIFVAVFATVLALGPLERVNIGVLAGTAAVFLVGVIDDVVHIKPSTKLLGQIAAASIACLGGVRVGFLDAVPFLAVPVTIVWIVGITNAFNLLDNMDGLSAGVAAISSFFIVVFAHLAGNGDVAFLAGTLGGAAAGFLLWNFNPAKIFMGDCGSMVLGYVLASAALLGTWHEAGNLVLVLATPALLLAVPIFDTTLVTVLRTMAGRPVSQGGRDHSSHRLVAIGMSERRAVLVLYAVCVTFGAVALAGLLYDLFAAAVGALLLLVGIFFFGVFLGTVPVYGPATGASASSDRPALLNAMILHKRRIAEVAVDFVLICAAYGSAYLLRYEGRIPPQDLPIIATTLPILLVVKLSAFFAFGVYRGVWKYVGIRDAVNLARAVVIGSLATVLVLVLAFRFGGMSRSVFVLDGLLLLFFASGSRVALRVFREMLAGPLPGGRRVLVYGAGDGGEMFLRELRNDPRLGMTAVGFVDDDAEKQGRMVHGVSVEGTGADLAEVAARLQAEEIVLAIPSASGERLAEIAAACAATGIPWRRTRRAAELERGAPGPLRELEILDVLARRAPVFDDTKIREAVAGKAIAILGAGGTIGNAVALRAAALGPSRILLLDRDDNALARARESLGERSFPISTALARADGDAHFAGIVARFAPEVVVHAAGIASVALSEENPLAAARAHVVEPAACAAASARAPVFVLASTMKAGNAATVLGATRQLGERAVCAAHPGARAVRLGNVLGSRGGILARFREQALAGGPLTLTSDEASRYVLSAEEAASALLLAAHPSIASGTIVAPDLEAPVRIADIAQAVVRWAEALRGGRGAAIGVVTVGLRAHDALCDPGPPPTRRAVAGGLVAFAKAEPASTLDAISSAVRAGDEPAVRAALSQQVPGLAERSKVIELRRP